MRDHVDGKPTNFKPKSTVFHGNAEMINFGFL